MPDKKYVKSVIKALAILELLHERGELGVTEIGAALDMDKSTTFRLLSTLREKGFAVAAPGSRKYAVGGKLFMLGQGMLRRHNVNPPLTLELKKLAAATGETVNLAVPDGLDVLYLDRHETKDIIKLAGSIGERRPMYCTSAGKAILARYRPEHAKALCSAFAFEPFTRFTHATPDSLLADLATVRERGYAVDNQEHRLGIHCLGIALADKSGQPLAAVSISIPQFRHEADPGKHALCAKALLEASDRLSAALLA